MFCECPFLCHLPELAMKLTIITINRNNAVGLEKTMYSVATQTFTDFEYIVVDGASTDGSVEVIRRFTGTFGDRIKWISEPDNGIYNAMNKGIAMATGQYCQFLNSGDYLTSDDVVEKMYKVLVESGFPSILYGNMLKEMPDGRFLRDKSFAGEDITFLDFYTGTLNHSPAYIKKTLFEKYGLYDESLKIVSDWKWYLQAIIRGKEEPRYKDIDVTIFDMSGISEAAGSKEIIKAERDKVLKEFLPEAILKDYATYTHDIYVMRRLHRHPWAYKTVSFIERCLFKIEKRRRVKRII